MDSSLLVRVCGFFATLTHGDSLVLDRWLWLKKRMPLTANNESVLDVGCGTGAFSIGAARRGYRVTGISWDERNQTVAQTRAEICRAAGANFVIGDVRDLDQITTVGTQYDVIICLECVEHILDDRKLFRDMMARLKPGGRLLLTTPNFYYHPMTAGDKGPFLTEETGWHVRRGYTSAMLQELCDESGLVCADVSHCSGVISQMVTKVWRAVVHVGGAKAAWAVTLPLRLLPVLLPDAALSRMFNWPNYSICLEAYKPRFTSQKSQ